MAFQIKKITLILFQGTFLNKLLCSRKNEHFTKHKPTYFKDNCNLPYLQVSHKFSCDSFFLLKLRKKRLAGKFLRLCSILDTDRRGFVCRDLFNDLCRSVSV